MNPQERDILQSKMFILRCVLTFLFLSWIRISSLSVVGKLIGIFSVISILDYADCNSWTTSWNQDQTMCRTDFYHSQDKKYDIFIYSFVLVLFSDLFSSGTLSLLWGLLIWRSIGTTQFLETKNRLDLVIYFDGFNAALLVEILSHLVPWVSSHYAPTMVLALGLKIVFEYWHHVYSSTYSVLDQTIFKTLPF